MPLGPQSDATDAVCDGISIRGLSHVYSRNHGQVAALDDISLQVPAGQFLSLVGSSGCGKTTLLDILTGLLESQSGEVLLANQPAMAGRRDTARMFARDALLPWKTAAQNVDFALATRQDDVAKRAARVTELLKAVGLGEFQGTYPGQLSQGMRQRVALARTFCLRSDFVFLDEPFGAVDALTKISLQEQLIALWDRLPTTTVVLVTHDLAEAVALSDRVVVMSPRPGRIAADVPVNLPRPRNVKTLQSSPEFHTTVAGLWEKLG